MPNRRSDESEESNGQELIQLRLKLRYMEAWRRQVEDPENGVFARLRVLEDYKLASQVRQRSMITWITIATTCFSAAMNLAEHMFWK